VKTRQQTEKLSIFIFKFIISRKIFSNKQSNLKTSNAYIFWSQFWIQRVVNWWKN